MKSLPERIMEYAEAKPEATPLQTDGLLHLGERAAVPQALSTQPRSGTGHSYASLSRRWLRLAPWY